MMMRVTSQMKWGVLGFLLAACPESAPPDTGPQLLSLEFRVGGEIVSAVDSMQVRRAGPLLSTDCVESYMISATVDEWDLAFPVTASGTEPVSDGFYGSHGDTAFVADRAETVRIEPDIVEVRFIEPVLCAWDGSNEPCDSLGNEATLVVEGPTQAEAVDITASGALVDIATGDAACVAPL